MDILFGIKLAGSCVDQWGLSNAVQLVFVEGHPCINDTMH